MPSQKTENTKKEQGELAAQSGSTLPTLSIDWDFYAEYLSDSGMSNAEKRETIEALLSIVIACVDLGIGMHPAQLAEQSGCESNSEITPLESPVMVECQNAFNKDKRAQKSSVRPPDSERVSHD